MFVCLLDLNPEQSMVMVKDGNVKALKCYSPSGGVPGAPGEQEDEQQDHGVRDAEAEQHGAGALGHQGPVVREPL